MNPQNRPLSPHLDVYKLPLTGLVSITHRMTGVILAGGLLFFVYSLLLISTSQDSYLSLQALLDNGFINLIVWLMIYALFFHFCHGIRHLIWDTGKGFEKQQMDFYIMIELGCSVVLTLIAALFL